ncbi:MAG: tetratricopeptide repeat protein, partial [Betaproteobacteria bacterium]|nr:tetratricopeptide repeat protein [Betaproteobacteria bacterium]
MRAALYEGYGQFWTFLWTLCGRTIKVKTLMAQGDYQRASQLLLRLIQKQPTNLDCLLGLAFCQKRMGRKDAHLQLLQEAHRLDDCNPSIVCELAQALVDARRSGEALPLLGLIKDEPGFSAAA